MGLTAQYQTLPMFGKSKPYVVLGHPGLLEKGCYSYRGTQSECLRASRPGPAHLSPLQPSWALTTPNRSWERETLILRGCGPPEMLAQQGLAAASPRAPCGADSMEGKPRGWPRWNLLSTLLAARGPSVHVLSEKRSNCGRYRQAWPGATAHTRGPCPPHELQQLMATFQGWPLTSVKNGQYL